MPVNKLEFDSRLTEIAHDIAGSIEQRIAKATIQLHGHVVETLSGPRSGKIYTLPHVDSSYWKEKDPTARTKAGKTWQASAPGEAPASRLGDLRTSYEFKIKGRGADAIGIVGSPLDYAYYLEKGTRRMKKRPHLIKAYQENKADIRRFFEGLI